MLKILMPPKEQQNVTYVLAEKRGITDERKKEWTAVNLLTNNWLNKHRSSGGFHLQSLLWGGSESGKYDIKISWGPIPGTQNRQKVSHQQCIEIYRRHKWYNKSDLGHNKLTSLTSWDINNIKENIDLDAEDDLQIGKICHLYPGRERRMIKMQNLYA